MLIEYDVTIKNYFLNIIEKIINKKAIKSFTSVIKYYFCSVKLKRTDVKESKTPRKYY